MDVIKIAENLRGCPCGRPHSVTLKGVEIASGLAFECGGILDKYSFPKKILLVADKNTLGASDGLIESLCGYDVKYKIFDDLRRADMREVVMVEELCGACGGILSVGTGCLNDICRLAAYRKNKDLALFATAPSMDGFASYEAPITENGFKVSMAAKQPSVIIADTKILADSPSILKSAGFGDMMGKYIGLIDWNVSRILTGEYYCENVAAITSEAVNRIAELSGRVTERDEVCAGKIMEALVLTGMAMSFTKNSRPASGTEHIVSHFLELKKAEAGEPPEFHGLQVGVASLAVLREYKKLAAAREIRAHSDITDYGEVYREYGRIREDIEKLNTPPITQSIPPEIIEKNWPEIREIVGRAPSADELERMLLSAGAFTEFSQINVSEDLARRAMKFHPYMRRRVSLMRLKNMIDI